MLNNKNQILFLKKVKEVDSYRRCAEALMWPIKHGSNDEEKGKTIKTIASFNFELPEVRNFFDKAKEYIIDNYGKKGREIYRYLDNLIIASLINEKTNNPIKKSRNKI